MTYTTIKQATEDQALLDRIQAAANKEAWVGGNADSEFARRLRTYAETEYKVFIWPTAIDYEGPYEFAINSSNPNPGGDPAVITDGNILASIQAHWPPDDVVAPPPADMISPPITAEPAT